MEYLTKPEISDRLSEFKQLTQFDIELQ